MTQDLNMYENVFGAAVVSEVESDADLSRMMQDLPAIEDLLETSDDAPP